MRETSGRGKRDTKHKERLNIDKVKARQWWHVCLLHCAVSPGHICEVA